MGRVAQLLGKVKMSPHVTNGSSDGLCLSGLEDSILAQLAGLRNGDVIHAINGHPVPDQKKAAQVLRKARKLGAAQVQLARGQEKRSLAFSAGAW
jgi:type II secretory pathway component PulC